MLAIAKQNVTKNDYKYLKKLKLQSGTTIYLENNEILVHLKKYPKSPYYISVLIHELYHATCHVMRIVGVKYSGKSEEAFAYLLGYYTKQVFKKMKKED